MKKFVAIFILVLLTNASAASKKPNLNANLPANVTASIYIYIDIYGQAEVYFTCHQKKLSEDQLKHLKEALSLAFSNSHNLDWFLEQNSTKNINFTEYNLSARIKKAFFYNQFEISGELNLRLLTQILAKMKIEQFYIDLSHTNASYSDCELMETFEANYYHYTAKLPGEIPVFSFKFGYYEEDIQQILFIVLLPLLFFCIPLIINAIIIYKAYHFKKTTGDATGIWLSYRNFLNNKLLAVTWIFWGVVFIAWFIWLISQHKMVVDILFARMSHFIGLAIIPGLLVTLLCMVMSWKIAQTKNKIKFMIWHTLIYTSLLVIPVICATIFLHNFRSINYTYLVWWALGSLFFGFLTLSIYIGPKLITSGDLFQYITEFTDKHNIKTSNISVIPEARTPRILDLGRFLQINDYVIHNFSQREIKELFAYRLTYLRSRPPIVLVNALMAIMLFLTTGIALCSLTVVAVALAAGKWERVFELTSSYHATAAILFTVSAVVGVIFYLYKNRLLRKTDKKVLQLSTDSHALISSIAKVARLESAPGHWQYWNSLDKHPMVKKRLKYISQEANIVGDELDKTLLAVTVDIESQDKFLTAEKAEKDDTFVFSSQTRTSFVAKNTWALLLIWMILPVSVAYCSKTFLAQSTWLAYLLGTVIIISMVQFLFVLMNKRFYEFLYSAMLDKLNEEGWELTSQNIILSGLSPAAQPHIYNEGLTFWDIGFVFTVGDQIFYISDQIRFTLKKEQIKDIRLGTSFPAWKPCPRLYIDWNDGEKNHVFHLLLVQSTPKIGLFVSLRKQVQNFNQQLIEWWQKPTPPKLVSDKLKELSIPSWQEIPAKSPHMGLSAIISNAILWVIICSIAILIAGFSFSEFAAGYVILLTLLANTVLFIPYWRYREEDI